MSTEYDIIFAGGEFIHYLRGTTACVIAGRLTATDPSLKILIVESDLHSRILPSHVQPSRSGYYPGAPNATTLASHAGTKPSTLWADGRGTTVQSSLAAGNGTSVKSLNAAMLYVRGAASDYNDWEALGNRGWSFNEVLPLIKKIETFTPVPDRPTHGYSGPIQISAGGTDLGFGSQFLNVARAYDPDRPQVDDINDFESANAYGRAYQYTDPVTGERSDAPSRYLYPHLRNPNLKIVVGKRVKRVIIENGRAVGIEYVSSATSYEGPKDELVTVNAAKLVIVSAGALGSPSILERSGIGAPSVLEKHNIHPLVDLPGVGENHQDHFGFSPVFYASDETQTMDGIWRDPRVISAQLKEWEHNGPGKVTHNGIEALVKARPTTAQLTSSGSALQSRWETFFQHSPDKPMCMILTFAGFPLNPALSSQTGRKIVSAIHYILYPEAVGSVHLTSGEDANSPPDIDIGTFKAGDIAQFTLLYKMTRELFRRMPAYRGEVAAYHPQFPPGSPAACTEMVDAPVLIDAPDIVYSDADDEAIAKFYRNRAFRTWHVLGTCAMKPRNQGGVVDERLNVYGVKGLKVADMSICPTNVGTNTYATALLIGEKAATIIAEDLGVRLHDK